jgi:hypothetical protein
MRRGLIVALSSRDSSRSALGQLPTPRQTWVTLEFIGFIAAFVFAWIYNAISQQ